VQEYVKLLRESRFGLSLTDFREEDDVEWSVYHWQLYRFSHSDPAVSEAEYEVYDMQAADYRTYQSDVLVNILYDKREQFVSVVLIYSHDLTVSDLGDRAGTVEAAGGSSGSSSSSGSLDRFVPNHAKLDCLECKGDKWCTKCDGHGSIQRYGQAGDWSTCPKCYGNKYCTACGGSGKRD